MADTGVLGPDRGNECPRDTERRHSRASDSQRRPFARRAAWRILLGMTLDGSGRRNGMQIVLSKDNGDAEMDVTVTAGESRGTIRFQVDDRLAFDLTRQGATRLVETLGNWLRA